MAINKNSVLSQSRVRKDSRTPFEQFKDFLATKPGAYFNFSLVVVPMIPFFSEFSGLFYLTATVLFLISRRRFSLPIHLPIFSKEKLDYNNLKPKTIKGVNVKTPSPPAGVLYVGNMQDTNEQVWWDKPLSCTHLFFLATTGGGKTYSFSGILSSFVIYSGFLYSDAKADLALIENYARMMWRMGRINQLFVLSFQAGNRSPWMIEKSEKMSHTFNPAAFGSAPMISELFKSLLDGDGDIWAKRGDNLSTVLIRPLTYMRDKYKWPMGFSQIASHFTLETLGRLAGIGENRNQAFVIPEDDRKYFKPLLDFIENIPGMEPSMVDALLSGDDAKTSKIAQTVRDQLGYVTMQLVNVTNDLIGDYGHIFETLYGQINLEDALTNRKVVITLLPALERSESTMSVLGRITLAAQKTIVANAQAFKLEGGLSSHIGTRPTASDVPYACINDEAGSFMVEGVSANTAMARSANIMFAFGGQDLSAMKKRGEMVAKEIDTIWGTTVNKMAGSVLESSTVQAFVDAADEELVLEATGYEVDKTNAVRRYHESNYQAVSRKKLTPKMLGNQEPGQVQLLTKSEVRSLTLPNYMTKNLSKPIVNFYLTETIPVYPMPIEDITIKKGMISKLKRAINLTEKFDVFAEQYKASKEDSRGVINPDLMLGFIAKTEERFAKPQYKNYSFFIASTLILFYIEEHAVDTIRSVGLKRPALDVSMLTESQSNSIVMLYGGSHEGAGRRSVEPESATSTTDAFSDQSDNDDDTRNDGHDGHEGEPHVDLSDEGINAFLGEIDKVISENTNRGTEVAKLNAESQIDAVMANSEEESDVEGPGAIQESAEGLEDNEISRVDLNLGVTKSSLHDISDLLTKEGIGSTRPTPITASGKKPVTRSETSVDDDLAVLDAVKIYRPEPIEPSTKDIAGALSAFLRSIKED